MTALLARAGSRLITSIALRSAVRTSHAAWRSLRGQPPTVHVFYDPEDPYSRLLASVMSAFAARYAVRIIDHLVPPPDAEAAADAPALTAWSHRDALRLASHYGLTPPDALPASRNVTPQALQDGAMLRKQLGHYLGGTLYFEGEWYWGIDRLHYLETRLTQAGLRKEPGREALYPPPAVSAAPTSPVRPRQRHLTFFCSLRSPYTYLAVARVRALAKRHGATLELAFVLPMVMRGLPVNRAKRLYIVRDAKREAERLHLPFGDIVDPVGAPTERGLAVMHHAIALGCGEEFLESFLRGVFAEGLDAGSDRGLQRIANRAGMNATAVSRALEDPSWRDLAQCHRDRMQRLGLWGVPSFRVDDRPGLWGQDRLFMVEQDLAET
ncbi:MAG: DsbA family protein [Nevskiaceae bacterium]